MQVATRNEWLHCVKVGPTWGPQSCLHTSCANRDRVRSWMKSICPVVTQRLDQPADACADRRRARATQGEAFDARTYFVERKAIDFTRGVTPRFFFFEFEPPCPPSLPVEATSEGSFLPAFARAPRKSGSSFQIPTLMSFLPSVVLVLKGSYAAFPAPAWKSCVLFSSDLDVLPALRGAILKDLTPRSPRPREASSYSPARPPRSPRAPATTTV
jgi:hypothetical protein